MTPPAIPRITLRINGERRQLAVEPEMPLLWALRETLALTGTKFGCGVAACGICTVHADGVPIRACVTPVSAVLSATIVTIEGLATSPVSPVASAVQQAWVARDVAQCGYCQSGQIMAATALLATDSAPTDAAINHAMRGVLCRCGTYPRIRAAIHDAAETLRAAAAP